MYSFFTLSWQCCCCQGLRLRGGWWWWAWWWPWRGPGDSEGSGACDSLYVTGPCMTQAWQCDTHITITAYLLQSSPCRLQLSVICMSCCSENVPDFTLVKNYFSLFVKSYNKFSTDFHPIINDEFYDKKKLLNVMTLLEWDPVRAPLQGIQLQPEWGLEQKQSFRLHSSSLRGCNLDAVSSSNDVIWPENCAWSF